MLTIDNVEVDSTSIVSKVAQIEATSLYGLQRFFTPYV